MNGRKRRVMVRSIQGKKLEGLTHGPEFISINTMKENFLIRARLLRYHRGGNHDPKG